MTAAHTTHTDHPLPDLDAEIDTQGWQSPTAARPATPVDGALPRLNDDFGGEVRQ